MKILQKNSHFIAREMAWVSGWASDISIWETEIYERFPSYSHRFIDYFDLVEADFFVMPESEIVVGWSLGTLALLKNLDKKVKEQKWILVCPIIDFCACWRPAVVRATTLESFGKLLGDVDGKDKWMESALRYSPEQLNAGLEFLVQTHVNLETDNYLQDDANIHAFFGTHDKIIPLQQCEGIACENLGHWLPDYIRTAPWSALVANDA
ncbi:MAG: hypothetical protein FWC15_01130 [Fibromonadales bacterium]|nr:hypothetical protein [Fibromonadales bacterium]